MDTQPTSSRPGGCLDGRRRVPVFTGKGAGERGGAAETGSARDRLHERAILQDLATRLKPGAPLVLAGNRHAYESKPLLMSAWAQRWRMNGASEEEVRIKQGKILQGADPPDSEEAVATLLADAGFGPPEPFFSSLFWGAWMARRL